MVLFNILWIVALITITFIYSYFFLERFGKYYLFYLIGNVIFMWIGLFLSDLLFNRNYPLFFLFTALGMQFLSITIMSFKSAFYYKDIINAERKQEEKRKLDNNEYYKQAKKDVNEILENDKEN